MNRTWTLEELMMGAGAANSGVWSRSPPPNAQIIYKIGIYGWRKRCLYVLILLLLVAVIINIALTVWILRVMDFNVDGMGKLRIVDDGVRVEGNSHFLKSLHATNINSRSDMSLFLQSSRNVTVNARNDDNKVTNRLVITDKRIESYGGKFEIKNSAGKTLFYADDSEIFIDLEKFQVAGSGGAVFKGSVQTGLIRSDTSNLRIEAPGKELFVEATDGVKLESSGGGISVDSNMDIKIKSIEKSILLDASSILMPNMNVSTPEFDGNPYAEVYQLCICSDSGKLFLASTQGNCQATSQICS